MYIRRNSELCCSRFLWLSNCFSISSTRRFLNQGLLRPFIIEGVESLTAGAESHRLRMRPQAQGDFLEELDKWRCSAGRQPEMPFKKSASQSRRWGQRLPRPLQDPAPTPVFKLEGGTMCYFLLGRRLSNQLSGPALVSSILIRPTRTHQNCCKRPEGHCDFQLCPRALGHAWREKREADSSSCLFQLC